MLKLRNAPIVEAVLDVDCHLRSDFNLAAVEAQAFERFCDRYPKCRKQFLQEFRIEANAASPSGLTARQAIQALQFLQDDEQQLVQVRAQGFSFNRLAPYSTLDDYLPEIERAWRLYVELAAPVETRVVRLRYINRMPLPLEAGEIKLDEFLKIGPRVADPETLKLAGFLIQQNAIEKGTEHEINVVLTAQNPENGVLPVILDITAASPLREEPGNWPVVRQTVVSLRRLKNRLFQSTLTDKCLQLFQ